MTKVDQYAAAKVLVLRDSRPSTSYVQRKLQILFNEAAGYIERMEAEGLITKADWRGRREITDKGRDEFARTFGDSKVIMEGVEKWLLSVSTKAAQTVPPTARIASTGHDPNAPSTFKAVMSGGAPTTAVVYEFGDPADGRAWPVTGEERRETMVAAAGGPEAYAAYVAASEALHKLAKHVPWSLGLDVADVYKGVTRDLGAAIQEARRRP